MCPSGFLEQLLHQLQIYTICKAVRIIDCLLQKIPQTHMCGHCKFYLISLGRWTSPSFRAKQHHNGHKSEEHLKLVRWSRTPKLVSLSIGDVPLGFLNTWTHASNCHRLGGKTQLWLNKNNGRLGRRSNNLQTLFRGGKMWEECFLSHLRSAHDSWWWFLHFSRPLKIALDLTVTW